MLSRIRKAKAEIRSVIDKRNGQQLDGPNRCLIQAFDLLCAAEVELREGKPQANGWAKSKALRAVDLTIEKVCE